MSRLVVSLVFGLSLLIGNSAFGWQGDSMQLIPSTLNQAIDKDAIQKSSIKKRGSAPGRAHPVADVKPLASAPSKLPIDFSKQQPAFSVAAQQPNPAPNISQPTPAEVPPADEASTGEMAEFGTVMSFRAANEPVKNAPLSNVYRVPSKFKLASAPIKPTPVSPVAASRYALELSVVGPDKLIENTAEVFELVLVNSSGQIANDIVVQMSVSEDLTVTDLDRPAWLDGEKRTVSWKISSLDAGSTEVIRFRAVSASQGRHIQNVSLGMANTFQGRTDFGVLVVKNSDIDSLQQPEFEN